MNLSKQKEFLFKVVIFLSSFLLFVIQPLLAKYFLPWFGGSSSVWAVCLFYFTTMLLLGYLYAYLLNKFSFVHQKIIHSILIFVALLFILINWSNWGTPLMPDVQSITVGLNAPFLKLLKSLFLVIGIPYFVLSSTAPLLQSWAYRLGVKSVYRFYAISNAGSLIALLSFPFLIEPSLPITLQAYIWVFCFCVFSFSLIFIIFKYSENNVVISVNKTYGYFSIKEKSVWVLLSFLPSFLLMVTTNHLTQVVASVPFLWIVPLVLYLLSFIFVFSNIRFDRGYFFKSLLIIFSILSFIFIQYSSVISIVNQVIIFSLYLFLASMFFHGLLYDKRPDEDHLTLFYLITSFGGALGTFFIAIVAPLLFSDFFEFLIGLSFVFFVLAFYFFTEKADCLMQRIYKYLSKGTLILFSALVMFSIVFNLESDSIYKERNFYGKVSITEDTGNLEGVYRILSNGTTAHGAQLVSDNKPIYPLSYYSLHSGVSVAFDGLRRVKDRLNVAVIGLGTGTIASYCRDGDVFDFYEIDPLIESVAYEYFDYLNLCKEHNIIIGDARLSLENKNVDKESGKYDLIVIDAFTDDSIPVHLLTKEAFQVYGSLLNSNGVLAVHISNRYLDLEGVVKGGVKHIGYDGFVYSSKENMDYKIFSSTWVVVAPKGHDLIQEFIKTNKQKSIEEINQTILWTDLYSNLFSVLIK